MGLQDNTVTANDNAPFGSGQDESSLDINHIQSLLPNTQRVIQGSEPTVNSDVKGQSLKLSVFLWIAALALGFVNFFIATSMEFQSFSALAILWAGVWTSYVASDFKYWRLSELAIISAMSGLMGIVIIAANYFGIKLTLIDSALIMSVLSLLMGFVLKSRIAVLVSICATLIWSTLNFLGAPLNNLIFIFPFFILGQIYCSAKINSPLTHKLTTLMGYIGIFALLSTLWTSGLMPITFIASLLFIIGVAQHRCGKAAEDSHLSGSKIHIFCGWVIAVTSAIVFQCFWLNPDMSHLLSTTPNASYLRLWKGAVALCILAIFISGIIRFKHTQITLPGIFLLTLGSSLIPLMMWFPQLPETLVQNVSGVKTVPTFGITIGAGVVAIGLGFAINGIRRKSWVMISLALMALAVEAVLLMTPLLFTADNIVIFLTALITTLAIGGTIAGNSLAFETPPSNLKYA